MDNWVWRLYTGVVLALFLILCAFCIGGIITFLTSCLGTCLP